jgi:hypothetical protein
LSHYSQHDPLAGNARGVAYDPDVYVFFIRDQLLAPLLFLIALP